MYAGALEFSHSFKFQQEGLHDLVRRAARVRRRQPEAGLPQDAQRLQEVGRGRGVRVRDGPGEGHGQPDGRDGRGDALLPAQQVQVRRRGGGGRPAMGKQSSSRK